MRGVCMVVYGSGADYASQRALGALERVCPDLPVHVHRERVGDYDDMQQSRYAKVTLLDWTPFEHTAYLDADTQVYGDISTGFQMLDDGWDMVIVPSTNQDARNWLWHCGETERHETWRACGYRPVQLQAGVFFVAKNARTQALWAAWRDEWHTHEQQDQAALLRALQRIPVCVWLLGRPWNGGAQIGHHFGALRMMA